MIYDAWDEVLLTSLWPNFEWFDYGKASNASSIAGIAS